MQVSVDDVRSAAKRIRPAAIVTPLLPAFDISNSSRLFLKPESLQSTGSFKIRGAYNTASLLREEERSRGLITYSSGNHAQALAYTAKLLGVSCTVVMPDDAKPIKIANTKALGAKVFLVAPGERRKIAEEMARDEGKTLVPPYDHPDVIAGQGTIGLEILEQLNEVDVVLVPIGGGALASGVAVAVKSISPGTQVIGVEPELAADAAEGLAAHHMVSWPSEKSSRTMADGLRTNLCPLTFDHLDRLLDDVLTVAEDSILSAVELLATKSHLVVEPSGAVGIAAYLGNLDRFNDVTTVAVLSGGNIDPHFFRTLNFNTP